MKTNLYGRVVEFQSPLLTVRNQRGIFQLEIDPVDSLSIGDIVEVSNRKVTLLTPNRNAQKSMSWMQRTLDPRRLKGMEYRSKVEQGIREFFLNQNFHETRTPLLVRCPGMETHIRPFKVISSGCKDWQAYLPTSPEFAMKRLLVGGLEKIFQICPAFRDEPHSVIHQPEFTMLEWYRAYAGYNEIMADTERLFEFLAIRLFGKPAFTFQGREISVRTPWPRLEVRKLFEEMTQVDLVKCASLDQIRAECQRLKIKDNPEDTWDDLYFKIWLNLIEPRLPADQAVFVARYPASQAALAVIDSDPDGSRWARRFEVYAGGIELGNAFEELTDPVEQRNRFVQDMNLREKIYGADFPKNPLDESFLGALTEGMPPSGGIAVGVDRMVMLFADEPEIDYTKWLNPLS